MHKIRQSPFIIYPSVNCCHFNLSTDGNLFPLRVAWWACSHHARMMCFALNDPPCIGTERRDLWPLQWYSALSRLPLKTVMSAAEVGACCSKLFWRRELRCLFTMHSTLTARRVGITEPTCGSPLGSSESESPWRSPALACILKTCHIQTPLGTSILPTASRPQVPALCCVVCSVKWKHMEKMPARPPALILSLHFIWWSRQAAQACTGWWRGGGGEEGMLDLYLLAVFSVIPAGIGILV